MVLQAHVYTDLKDVCVNRVLCLYVYVQVLLVSRRRRESRTLCRSNMRFWSPCLAGARQAGPESERYTGSEQRQKHKKRVKDNEMTEK